MRALADAERIHELMRALGRGPREQASIYFTGGATAVLYGWRPSTVDVDLRLEPGRDEILRALGARGAPVRAWPRGRGILAFNP